MGVSVHELAVWVDMAVSAGEAIDVGVVVVLVIVVVFVGVLHGRVPMSMLVCRVQRESDSSRGQSHRDHLHGIDPSPSTTHANTAPRNGAVAKITWPRAAPSCCAARTHSVMTPRSPTFQPRARLGSTSRRRCPLP